MTDRRHSDKRARSEASAENADRDADSLSDYSESSDSAAFTPVAQNGISLLSEAVSTQLVHRDTEVLLADHFASTYYDTIMLPDCHADFYVGWTRSIQQIMKDHHALYYAVLSCSASQFHSLTQVPQMHDLALDYYSRSMKKVGQLLDRKSVAMDDVLLNSIIFLYLNGVSVYIIVNEKKDPDVYFAVNSV